MHGLGLGDSDLGVWSSLKSSSINGSGFWDQNSEFKVQGTMSRVQGSGLMV